MNPKPIFPGAPANTEAEKADLIFVLAGRPERKTYALGLFRRGCASRLLLSVARFEIRRFKQLDLPAPLDLLPLAADIAPPLRHFFVCYQGESVRVERIPIRRLGTFGEMEALASWLRRHAVGDSVLVVTSAPHLWRVRACARTLLPTQIKVRFLAVPREVEGPAVGWPGIAARWFLMLTELGKLILYRLVLAWRRFVGSGFPPEG